MDIQTIISTGTVLIGLFRCSQEHYSISEVTLGTDDTGEQIYEDIICKTCSNTMECKSVKTVEFSYEE